MVGAGISHPSVPLAIDIINHCKEVAQNYGRSADAPDATAVAQYSNWFQTAYSEPYQRQEYLQQLIENKSITHANFRLAHLLLDNTISNIVITTNFDDFLSKALTLFGKAHIVCDHPQTVGRINHAQPMLQIVHLHGSYWFYDCINLRGELEDRAQQSQQTTLTMASLLVNILWDRSPLVIGYSGWEGDVFTEALRRRLAQPLRSNAYWFCYRRSDIDSLPEWLKGHPNISFVVPRKTSVAKVDIDVRVEQTEAHEGFVEGIEVTGLSKKDAEPLLPADTVLSRLIQAFDLEAPKLTRDPLGFFASQLDNSLPKDSASDSDSDIYAIKRVIERVRKAKEREDEESVTRAITPAESQLERVRDALRRADYREAIKEGHRIDLASLLVEQLSELADAIWTAAEGLNDDSEDELAAYQLVVAILRQLEKTQGFESPASRIRLANAFINSAVVLITRKRYEEAISICDEVLQHYGEASDIVMQQRVASGLLEKGYALAEMGRRQEAIAVCDEFMRRFGEASAPALQEQLALVLFNKGVTLGELEHPEEAIAVYDDVVRRFEEASAPVVREQVAMGLVNKGILLGALNRHGDAIAVCDDVVSRFGTELAPALMEQVAKALTNKAFILRELKREDEAIAVYDEVLIRFGDATEPSLKEEVKRAHAGKALLKKSKTPSNSTTSRQ